MSELQCEFCLEYSNECQCKAGVSIRSLRSSLASQTEKVKELEDLIYSRNAEIKILNHTIEMENSGQACKSRHEADTEEIVKLQAQIAVLRAGLEKWIEFEKSIEGKPVNYFSVTLLSDAKKLRDQALSSDGSELLEEVVRYFENDTEDLLRAFSQKIINDINCFPITLNSNTKEDLKMYVFEIIVEKLQKFVSIIKKKRRKFSPA